MLTFVHPMTGYKHS